MPTIQNPAHYSRVGSRNSAGVPNSATISYAETRNGGALAGEAPALGSVFDRASRRAALNVVSTGPQAVPSGTAWLAQLEEGVPYSSAAVTKSYSYGSASKRRFHTHDVTLMRHGDSIHISLSRKGRASETGTIKVSLSGLTQELSPARLEGTETLKGQLKVSAQPYSEPMPNQPGRHSFWPALRLQASEGTGMMELYILQQRLARD